MIYAAMEIFTPGQAQGAGNRKQCELGTGKFEVRALPQVAAELDVNIILCFVQRSVKAFKLLPCPAGTTMASYVHKPPKPEILWPSRTQKSVNIELCNQRSK
uniref:HDC14680 n=1 Tax=Drosophila melanogaster TaxID=7227 RepID=Q6IJL0_DROME|nr:TPA_inf: HDC14680 [Drosophila melanogaster]